MDADSQRPAKIFQLSWIDSSDNETGFRIERRQVGKKPWKNVATVDANTESYEDTVVGQAGGSYEFRVFAINSVGDSPSSNEVTADSDDTLNLTALREAVGSFDLFSMLFLTLFAGFFRRKIR